MTNTMRYSLIAACLGALTQAHAFEIAPKGSLQLDYAAHEEDVEPLDDDFEVRRARLGVEGEINPAWAFEVVYDFTDDGAFADAYLRYQGWDAGNITAGQFKLPFGLEELTSSSNITFIERALPGSAFALSRRLGVGFDRAGRNYTVGVMGFGRSIDDDDDEGEGLAARFTFAPVDAGKSLIHLGIAAMAENPKGEVSINTGPESAPTDFDFVRTGGLDNVKRIAQVGLEAAWRQGPISAQAEWMGSELKRDGGFADASLSGWYAAASWFLTGESRVYKDGVFRGIDVDRRSGAWELAARYSDVALDDGEVRGGDEQNATLGLNWYAKGYKPRADLPAIHLRLMGNYIKVHSERRGLSDDPDILLFRAQLAF